MFASAALATLYFLILPVIWLGALGADAVAGDLAQNLGPTFAPLLGGLARSVAMLFMVFNMFHGTLAPLTGVARTLSQLSEDGLVPRFLARRNRFDCPWVAITITAACAIVFLLIGDPIWLIAAANFTYLIGIALPNVAVWLLRRDQPDMARPYRAPRGTITLGLIAAAIWGVSTILGFQVFGLPTVIVGLFLAYSGAVLYAWRKYSDRRREGRRGIGGSLHIKLTGTMLLVLLLDGAGYISAINSIGIDRPELRGALQDIFVAVAILTITVGLVLPGMIAHAAGEVSKAAKKLTKGTLADFSRAMEALSAGDLEGAHAHVDAEPVIVHSHDELGEMAASFNELQLEIKRAAVGLDGAREGLRLAKLKLTHAALYDNLTGLPNRTLLNEQLSRAMLRSERKPGEQFAVLFLDFDRFKLINDSFGHELGDMLLVAIGQRLNELLRGTDTAARFETSTPARLGGDEFVILLQEMSRATDAAGVASRLLEGLSKPYQIQGHKIQISTSIGITTSDLNYQLPEDMLRDADTAMYHAKAAGKAQFAIFDPQMHERVVARLKLEGDLRNAIEQGSMLLHYQPVISLATERIKGFEALVRWNHPERGLISPVEFISCCEETGLIVPLGFWALEEGCRQLRAWRGEFPDVRLDLSVNLSVKQLTSPDLSARMGEIIRAHDIDPGTISLEITESVFIGDAETTVEALRDLKQLGFQLYLDDFGTGYSSLSCLHRLPLDCVKIDRSFVESMCDRQDHRNLVQGIIDLGTRLGLDLIAEGVETAEQVALLRSMECKWAQGFFFSPPIAAADANTYIRKSWQNIKAA
jgi:diguanylate cyclase (GGDEF)-like protein